MNIIQKRKIKKIGFTESEVNDMTIKDIIKLGEMGYTKDEITKLGEEPENDLAGQIESLKAELDKLVTDKQIEATHDTVTEDSGLSEPDKVQEALKILAGDTNNDI